MLSARLSLLVYLNYILINAIAFAVMCAFFFFSGLSAGAFKLTITLVSIVYWIFVISCVEKVKIFADKQGIRVFYGIFPWQKRQATINWSDLQEIFYIPSTIGWVLQSYTIKLKTDLVGEHELTIPHVWRGKQFVEKVNKERLLRTQSSPAAD